MSIEQENHHPGDSRFFSKSGPYTIETLVKETGAQLNSPDILTKDIQYTGIAPLQIASSSEVSFLDNKRYLPLLAQTKAGVVIVAPAFADKVPQTSHALVTSNPYLAWARVATLFYPKTPAKPGVHPTAYIHPDAVIHPSVEVQAFAVVMNGVHINKECIIGAHSVIEQGVQIGQYCRIGNHVSLSHAVLGDRVTLYSGARIGQDGFGFAIGEQGFVSIPQIGKVILKNDVEVGANSTIDRGSVKDTIIGEGSRLDNLVQIGHNVEMGRCCIVVSQAGISGSTQLGDFVTIAAQAGLIGHIHIGDHARVGAQCGVMSDVEAKSDVIGSPAMPFKEFFKNVAFLRRMAKSSKGKEDSQK
ncbi:UDP-3-O-(3-hydroxymyristoyl)glucosamine N-acyltransferase [Commensalibacter papalotli (ex Botero et al. 2024)]|uniref:UDP-3-O-acylglucosamine N-acyltransferase n=1 Tax=Commensalibacter papalotli (ex Botero et al. 2024) TaxID=2972766 RepID=A0ABN8WA49_9PROT|nr:UDP-3-O-(3-hydroxymyristoyl)glucosamine N-acyltransferase [Commensalibacter papalotli (ex Botero et al. 2024)]CAI3924845.1 UDP-3-O-[3-hydroxymyristoyl] glucosamine N-acyltransferase (LpxD) (PDB:6P83) [Commensalibacter papalotli (ex Botero et al. 2024)]CAI3927206.1 UDP-3-O-[3-hydroxymyristoyl] glucosamine N-acyltransferase (LpxD) (PDB:6P83) [Commensalibacter papalotli (ex Botero et al. 2024)]